MIKYPLFKVSMPKDMHLALQPVLESGFVSEGPKAKEFETKMQEWLGNPHTALTNSGTSALIIALRLADVEPGDEVLTTAQTCVATNSAILTVGGKVVWADINPRTGNIDPSGLEKLITKKTKAIMCVDWSGIPCEYTEIHKVAAKYGLRVIQDAAHSNGGFYKGFKVGTIPDTLCAFSYQAIKHFTTCDGGSVATTSKNEYERAILLRWFGLSRTHNQGLIKWDNALTELGYKFHQNDLNATIGLESLKIIDGVIQKHKENGKLLRNLLSNSKYVENLDVEDYMDPSYWICTIKLKNPEHRQKVTEGLTSVGIGCGVVHTDNSQYELFSTSKVDLPGVREFSNRQLNVPCGWWLSTEDVHYIAENVLKFAES